MRLLRPFLLGVLIILGLYLGIALLLPAKVQVARAVVIAAPPERVFNYVANLRHWQEWSPWATADSTAQHFVSEAERGVGAFWSWQGEKIGEGRLTRLSEKRYTRIESELEFYSPREVIAKDIWVFEAVPEGTVASWMYEQKLGYPRERYLGLFYEKMLAPGLESGLQTLKTRIEN